MPDVPTPVEVGFSEFIARLISEVFASVVTAQAEQEERYAELLAAASLEPAEYVEQHLSGEELLAELQRLFPPRPEDKQQPHAIYVDAPYLPARGEQAESPPLGLIGLSLEKSDLKRQAGGPSLLRQSAVDKVESRVSEALASVRLRILKEMAARGIPRVQVDSGRINGKMTFHLLEEADETPSETTAATGSATAGPRLNTLGNTTLKGLLLPKARILPHVRVLVRQADERAPSVSQVKANVFGEVEITFKTVT